ncbi:unnamed protein product [Discula destructiva]
MRLLNTKTLELADFVGDDIPPYAILSHTWSEEEVTLRDMQDSGKRSTMLGFDKIISCCKQAGEVDELDWVWVDTCCIDKTSSAELSEAINSMFTWYKKAVVCYAYLSDVPPLDPFINEMAFSRSRWFTRGWTLQELLAPRELEFYAQDWTELGTKWSLYEQLTAITSVPRDILLGKGSLGDHSVAERMSWASNRETTRVEDMAYSLLGIFDINMPLLYGEGRRAFFRLQQEVLTRELDFTIFLWSRLLQPGNNNSAFCDTPSHFPVHGIRARSGEVLKYSEIRPYAYGGLGYGGIEAPVVGGNDVRMRLFTDWKGLAWIFAFHHGLPLCIGIESMVPESIERDLSKSICKRTDSNDVVLGTAELLKTGQIVEVHMPAFQDSNPGPHRYAPSETCEFSLILESTPTERLSLVAIEPPYITRLSDSAFKIVFSLVDCPPKFAILLRVFQTEGIDKSPHQQVAIVFSLFHGPWSCVPFTTTPILPLRELLQLPSTTPALGPLDGQTDRALVRLPGRMNYLRIASKRRPNSHRAYVSLLPVPVDERFLARSMGVGTW